MSLTANVCAGLLDYTNNKVLVSAPVVKVVEVAPGTRDIGDFEQNLVATVIDGSGGQAELVLPRGYKTWSAANGSTGQPQDVAVGDTIKVQQMLRLFDGNESVIVAYAVEIDNGDDDMPLDVTNYEDKIAELRLELQRAHANVQMLAKNEVGEGGMQTLFNILDHINRVVEGVLEPAVGGAE